MQPPRRCSITTCVEHRVPRGAERETGDQRPTVVSASARLHLSAEEKEHHSISLDPTVDAPRPTTDISDLRENPCVMISLHFVSSIYDIIISHVSTRTSTRSLYTTQESDRICAHAVALSCALAALPCYILSRRPYHYVLLARQSCMAWPTVWAMAG